MVFWSGEKLSEELEPLISDYDEDAIDCAAYTLTVGNEIYISPDHAVETPTRHTKQRLRPGEGFAIPPGQFAFLTTKEEVTVPDNALAFISIRARHKFRGLINISGFHVDPGYKGQLVFSVLNAGPTPHHLEEGEKLFLIWYADLDRKTEMKKETKEGFSGLDPTLVNDISGEILSLQNLSDRQRDLERDLNASLSSQRETVGQVSTQVKNMTNLLIALLVGIALLVAQGFWPSDSAPLSSQQTKSAVTSSTEPQEPSSAPISSDTQSP